MNNLTKQ